MKIYRNNHKPVIVAAILFTGSNYDEACEFTLGHIHMHRQGFRLQTSEGDINFEIGDYLILDANGYYFACNKFVFENNYTEDTSIPSGKLPDSMTSLIT